MRIMKKFFYLSILAIFCVISTFSLSSCKNNDLDKISKNLTAYAISAKFDDEKKQIQASEKIEYVNVTGDGLECLCLHLYPRAFRKDALIKPYSALNVATCFPNGLSYGDLEVQSVKVEGQEKEFEIVGEDEDILKIIFGFVLSKNDRADVVIDFLVTIPNSTHRFGYFDANVNLGNWYPIVCVFKDGDFDTTPYYSTGDPFMSDVSNYEIEFSCPKDYFVSASGVAEEKVDGDTKVLKMKATAVRDFALCLSKNAAMVESKVGDTLIRYVGYENDENISSSLQVAADAVSYFNEAFGKYPYETLTVSKTPFLFGGMEYPGLVFISDSIEDENEYKKVIVHEIAHQWWCAVVGNNESKEAWLDESLAEYSTALFFGAHEKYGLTYDEFVSNALSSYLLYVDVIETIRGEVNTKMNLPVHEYKNDYEYSYMVYVKGVIMFDSLKSAVGEKKLVSGLAKYYAENKFKIADKNDFYSAFKSACHKDLETFFEGYLNGTAIISKIN